jgi:hypothetical protein
METLKIVKTAALPVLGLLAILILAVVLFRAIRKRFLDREDRATDGLGMLSQIRELHARGELSEEEYRSIKGRLIGKPDAPATDNPPTAEATPREEAGKTRKDEG